MARGDFKYRIALEVDDKASAPVAKVQGRFSKLGNFLKNSFVITLGDVIGLFRSLSDGIGSVVEAAKIQEDAVKRLDQSLASLGTGAAAVSKDLQDQAAALEATTKFADEAIIANQALAINLGVSAKDVKKLTAAAVELSAATGGSLESSFVNLARTLNGFRGELGELVPEVARLTEEELKAGKALDAILGRLGGSAVSQVETFSGALAQLGNAWGTIKEKLGAAFTENEAIRTSIKKLKDVMTSPEFLKSIESIAEGFGTIAAKAVTLVANGDRVVSMWRNMYAALIPIADALTATANAIVNVTNALTFGFIDQLKIGANNILALAGATGVFETAAEKAAKHTKSLGDETEKSVPKLQTYKALQLDTAASLEERNDATRLAIDSAATLDQITEAAATSASEYESAERALRQETDALAQSFDRAANAANRVNSATGGRLTARDRRSQADVDLALSLGREVYMGGRRIRTADGTGSRLVG